MNYLSIHDKTFPDSVCSSKVIVFLTPFFLFAVHYVFKHSPPSQVQRIQGSGWDPHIVIDECILHNVNNHVTAWILSQNFSKVCIVCEVLIQVGYITLFLPPLCLHFLHNFKHDHSIVYLPFFFSAARHIKWISAYWKFLLWCSICKLTKHSYCSIYHWQLRIYYSSTAIHVSLISHPRHPPQTNHGITCYHCYLLLSTCIFCELPLTTTCKCHLKYVLEDLYIIEILVQKAIQNLKIL